MLYVNMITACWIYLRKDKIHLYFLYNSSSLRWCKQLKSWWRHQMETFYALLAICAGNSPVPGEFPAQRPVTQIRALMFSLICTRINGWVNNGEAGHSIRHRAHYDVTVMLLLEEDKDPFIIHNQYHGCWWSGDARSMISSTMVLT